MSNDPTHIAELLRAASDGDDGAQESLLPLLYDELRRLAHHLRRGEAPGQTLQTTEVVHEAYLRLAQAASLEVRDQRHFMRLAARTMRRVLVDRARQRQAEKRGGGVRPSTLDGPLPAQDADPEELLALDDALSRLTDLSPRLGQVVELRYFGGLSIEETAGVLDVGRNTVNRDWAKARAWLYRELVV